MAQQFPESEYCTFLSADGQRCRAIRMPTRHVCLYHWKHDGQFDEDEATIADLLARSQALDTRRGVNRALGCLFRQYAQGRIPHRRAALLAYVGHLLLCTMPRGRKQQGAASEDALTYDDGLAMPAAPDAVENLQPAAELVPIRPGPNGAGGSGSGEHE